MEATFIAAGIKVTKTNFHKKKSIEAQIERFRIDMLAKYDLLFKKAPHLIKISHEQKK